MVELNPRTFNTNGKDKQHASATIGMRFPPQIAFIDDSINPEDALVLTGANGTPNEFSIQDSSQIISPLPPQLTETNSFDRSVTDIEATQTVKKTRRTWVNEVYDTFQAAKDKNDLPEHLREYLFSNANFLKRMSAYRNYLKGMTNENKIAEEKPDKQINYWGGTIYQSQTPRSEDQEQRQDYQNYVAGSMRVAGVLEFISETELPLEERGGNL